jgi:hypothetical protein
MRNQSQPSQYLVNAVSTCHSLCFFHTGFRSGILVSWSGSATAPSEDFVKDPVNYFTHLIGESPTCSPLGDGACFAATGLGCVFPSSARPSHSDLKCVLPPATESRAFYFFSPSWCLPHVSCDSKLQLHLNLPPQICVGDSAEPDHLNSEVATHGGGEIRLCFFFFF